VCATAAALDFLVWVVSAGVANVVLLGGQLLSVNCMNLINNVRNLHVNLK